MFGNVTIRKVHPKTVAIGRDQIDYGQICRLPNGRVVVVLGNVPRDDGTRWVGDYETGEISYPQEASLKPAPELQRPLDVTARKFEAWARAGNCSAMWWLGYHHEFGGDADHPCPEKALAYYMAAFRHTPSYGADGIFQRVLNDSINGFEAEPTRRIQQRAVEFCQRFVELESWLDGARRIPVNRDWEEAIRIAEEDHPPAESILEEAQRRSKRRAED